MVNADTRIVREYARGVLPGSISSLALEVDIIVPSDTPSELVCLATL